MTRFLGRLFTTPVSGSDGLTQAQREALVDLLHLCMCADDKLRRVEDRMIAEETERFAWESAVPLEDYASLSLARAQAAVQTFGARAAFLAAITEKLETEAIRIRARELCRRLFYVDQEYPDAEQVVFREIREAFR